MGDMTHLSHQRITWIGLDHPAGHHRFDRQTGHRLSRRLGCHQHFGFVSRHQISAGRHRFDRQTDHRSRKRQLKRHQISADRHRWRHRWFD